MIRNHLITSFRNLARNKSYALINILGLCIGITCCLMIFLVLQFETGFDNFHQDAGRIFRVCRFFDGPEGKHYTGGSAFPLSRDLKLEYPQLVATARINSSQGDQITVMDGKAGGSQKKFKEAGLFFADPSFFRIFNFPFIAGNPGTALANPYTAVMTKQAATRYFGDWHEAMGKYIVYQNKKVCLVTGILKDIPPNTDFPLQVVLSMKTTDQDSSSDLASTQGDLNTYVVLPKTMSEAQFDRDLNAFSKRHQGDLLPGEGHLLQPLRDIHFDPRYDNYNHHGFSRDLISAVSLTGLFLLLIACINFVNLATAQAGNRSREVGVRKVLGGRKSQLRWQFMTETFLITLSSILLGLLGTYTLLPLTGDFLNASLSFHLSGWLVLFLGLVLILVTILSGFYPAWVLSGFNPAEALKLKSIGGKPGGISLRRVLVVFQFTIAQALIIGTLIIIGQMDFFRNAPMGFDKDNIVNVPIPGDSTDLQKLPGLKDRLLEEPGVREVSFSTFSISDNFNWNSPIRFDHSTRITHFPVELKWADAASFRMFHLQFVAGHPYDASDTVKGFVVNEQLVRSLGIHDPRDILGKNIDLWGGQITAPVVGVIRDFHGQSLTDEVKPTMMASWKNVYQNMSVKVSPFRLGQTLGSLRRIWSNTFPEEIYSYQFLDDKIAGFYRNEEELSKLFRIFALIAIFISCLGLYGLISFMAVKRTREVGIRKVLGATAGQIVYLFSREFTLLIGLSFLIAAPVAAYFMHEWLDHFAYRIHPGPGVFILTLAGCAAIAWATMAYRAIQAALANPVKSLRTE